MRAAAILALLAMAPAAAQEAPRREAVEVLDGTFRSPDGELHEAHGGAYLPLGSLLAVTSELAALRAQKAAAVAPEPPPSVPKLVFIALGVGFALGVGATLYLRR